MGLWFFFMIATAYTSAATLLDRVASTDVMKAASGNAWSGVLVWQALSFLAAQLLLHLAFALVCWLLALASTVIAPKLAVRFGRIVVGWFCVLAAAALIYNALWYPGLSSARITTTPCRGKLGVCIWVNRLLRCIRVLRAGTPPCVPSGNEVSGTCSASHVIGGLCRRGNDLHRHGDLAESAVCGCGRSQMRFVLTSL